MTHKALPVAIRDDFYERAVRRMHETGIITADALGRMLATPPPDDAHTQIGIYQALLAVAIWRDEGK